MFLLFEGVNVSIFAIGCADVTSLYWLRCISGDHDVKGWQPDDKFVEYFKISANSKWVDVYDTEISTTWVDIHDAEICANTMQVSGLKLSVDWPKFE